MLREYVQYWQAQASIALGQKAEALEQLESFRRDFSESVMTDQVIAALAQTAFELNKPADALAAFDCGVSQYGLESQPSAAARADTRETGAVRRRKALRLPPMGFISISTTTLR